MVELLVTLTIGSIMLSLAAPSLSSMLAIQRSNSTVNAMYTVLNLARNEAIKRNGRAVLCKSADAATCTASGGWEQGWILFVDSNNNAIRDAGETVIQVQAASAQSMRISGNAPVSRYISYSASGTAKLTSGAFQAGTLTVCQVNGTRGEVRQLVLSGTGRVRLQKGSPIDCP